MSFIGDRGRRWGWLAVAWALAGCGGSQPTADAEPAAGGDMQPAAVSANAAGPVGAAAVVTGGAGGATVRVSTPAQLKYELCRSSSGGACTDAAPRTVEIATTIALADTEGVATARACNCSVAALRGMLVGSNKTVLGIGATAAVKGRGFLLQSGVSNIVIRNLSITDIGEGPVSGGDAVAIADASRVWIDHNRFARVGRQFIATGTGDRGGAAADVTISWNEFDGKGAASARRDDRQDGTLLFCGKGRMTFAYNWLHDFSEHGPHVEGDALVHLVNNHFQDGARHALDAAGRATRVLAEGNYFENVPVPILRSAEAGPVHALLAQTPASKAACSAALGRPCEPNIANPMAATNDFAEDPAVLDAAGAVPSGSLVSPWPARKVPAWVSAGVGVGHVR